MIQYAHKCLQTTFILLFILHSSNAVADLDLNDQDAQFRENVVGKIQVNTEKTLIEAKNGVFILFTPTHGTPQMISENGDIPLGLIPKERMKSYQATVKPRVKTTHQMPAANVKCIYIRYHDHRPQVEDPAKPVDETYYQQFLAKYPSQIVEKIIPEQTYAFYHRQNMPAAFYYYKQNNQIHYTAIFGKQINASIGNKLTDPSVYYNRKQDLDITNKLLIDIGLKTIEEIFENSQKK